MPSAQCFNRKNIDLAKDSAGILFYRRASASLEVLLAHPGGPFWKNKDAGAWTIPKGEISDGENKFETALREVKEELGVMVEGENSIQLTPVKLKSGKVIHAWAVEKDVDETAIRSNSFELEWPPQSGKKQLFPEIDRAMWFSAEEGKTRINPGQRPLIDELTAKLSG